MKRVLFFTFALLASLFAMAQSSQRPQYVVFRVIPKTATVIIGGKSVATDSDGVAIFTLPNGTYSYTVSAKACRSTTGTFEVYGEKVIKSVKLLPVYGWLTISTSNLPDGAKIYIDGALVEQMPIEKHKLSSGNHTVRIVHECYKVLEQSVTIRDAQTSELTPTLTPRVGTLNVMSTPAFANVYVDDKLVGQTPLMVDIIIGEHKVKVDKGGFRAESRSVNVSEGGVADVSTALTEFTYKIGDVMTVNGVKGVVFEVTEDGEHGKVLCANQAPNYMSWGEAKTWCSNLGSGWYLPTKEELLLIYQNKAALNSTLATIGGKIISYYWYWSSTVFDSDCAWNVLMSYGSTSSNNKNFNSYVRAVSAF